MFLSTSLDSLPMKKNAAITIIATKAKAVIFLEESLDKTSLESIIGLTLGFLL